MSKSNYREIQNRLKEPIPENLISKKTKGANSNIRFVNVTDCKDLLDKRVGDGGTWDAIIVGDQVVGEAYVVKVRIRIFALDGTFEQDGIGLEKINLNAYGDPATNAYAKAFRRAAEGHGLARELWREEISEDQWNLPASENFIRQLAARAVVLERQEAAIAGHYSEGRATTFAALTMAEATVALKDTARFIKKDGSKK